MIYLKYELYSCLFSVDAVVKTFIELVEKDNCNGDVVTVDTMRGTKYHYTNKL